VKGISWQLVASGGPIQKTFTGLHKSFLKLLYLLRIQSAHDDDDALAFSQSPSHSCQSLVPIIVIIVIAFFCCDECLSEPKVGGKFFWAAILAH
jgi:hypothetical protein